MKIDDRKIIEGTLFVLKENDKYLLRFETSGINANYWIFPGGSYDRKQSGERELGIECALREIQEEAGLTPLNPKLKARIFFDNFKRVFPNKTEIANFDFDVLYFYSESYQGEFRETSPDNKKQRWFTYQEALSLPMHEGDRKILEALETLPPERIIEGRIVHDGSKLEGAVFKLI